MTVNTQIETNVEPFWQGLQTGQLDTSDSDTEELTADDGQHIQIAVLDKWQQQGAALGGYKVGLTSGQARNMFGQGVRPFGFILQDRILASAANLEYSSVVGIGVENELVFRLGSTLAGDNISRADAFAAIDGVAPGFEINQMRFRGAISQGARIADNLSQWGIVAGEFQNKNQDYDKLTVQLSCDQTLRQTVNAEGHIDNHFDSIAALANRLHRFGKRLEKGMYVITGSFTRQKVIGTGDWLGDFGDIGQVSLKIT
ncbi:MAG: hypothetical protein KUG79_11590 [Pseudomonadales bacterium]|nr:hypothetical protein [Pseudomonadales bacterium]